MKGILFLFLFLLAVWVLVALTGCASLPGSVSLSYEGAALAYKWDCQDCKRLQHLDK